MERLAGEARDRVRAMGLWLITGLLLGGVLAALFATLVGFAEVGRTTISAAVPSEDGHRLTVHYLLESPGCERLHRVEVTETADTVELRVHTATRRPWRDPACATTGVTEQVDVILDAPLGDRTVRDGDRDVPRDARPGRVSGG